MPNGLFFEIWRNDEGYLEVRCQGCGAAEDDPDLVMDFVASHTCQGDE